MHIVNFPINNFKAYFYGMFGNKNNLDSFVIVSGFFFKKKSDP
jgi:hypothetical protein